MRVKVVFGLLFGLFAAFGVLTILRGTTPHQAPAPPASTAAAVASTTASSASASAAASASGAPASSSSAAAADAGPIKLLDRPLRVISLGWDLAAPGVLANGGLEPSAGSDFLAAGVETRIVATDVMTVVEAALARGGADKDGADVAILPFSQFVASYERLRALTPEAFFVLGWSRGREAVISTKDALPTLNEKGEPKEVKMIGVAGEPAAFLGLFALDAAGIPASAVRLVPADTRPEDAALAAVDRDAAPADAARRNILLTTADASHLVPFVAVAQHGLLEKSNKALAAWARVWLEGAKKLAADSPTAARQIAAAPGAPEPIALLKRLGQTGSATLTDNTRTAGLSGRGAMTLDALFQRTWRIWRAAGLLATPAPEAAPIATSVIAALVHSNPELITPALGGARTAPAAGAGAGAGGKATNALDSLRVMITFRQAETKLDEADLISSAAFFADAFERSPLRVSVMKSGNVDAAATKHLIDAVEERFDIATGRLSAAKKAVPKAAAGIEVLAAP